MPTLMEQVQTNIRAVTGTSGMYWEDWHALCTSASIPPGQINERVLAYYNKTNTGPATFDAVHNYYLHNPSLIASYSPSANFTGGQQGAWYDPSTFPSLYQDSMGSTLVTATSQSVGLMLDKRLGLVPGSELVSNPGPFSSVGAWLDQLGNAPLSVSSGQLFATPNTSAASRSDISVPTTVGNWYTLTVDMAQYSGAGQTLAVLTSRNGSLVPGTNSAGALGITVFKFIAATAVTYLTFGSNISTIGVANIINSASIKDLLGNHISQATASARPIVNASNSAQYLTFDGVNDGMSTGTITLGASMDCFVAIRRNTAAQMLIAYTTTGGSIFFGVAVSGDAGAADLGSGTPTYSVDGVSVNGGSTGTTRGQLHTAMTSSDWHVLEVRNLNMSTWASFAIAGYGSYLFNGDIGGIILCPAGDATARANNRKWLGNKVGLSL